MNALCWNCRGLGNPWTVRQLKRWKTSLAPDIMFLSETKIKKVVAENLKERIGYSNAIGVSSVGLAGGLCLYWDGDSISFNLQSFSQNHISGVVVGKDGVTWCFIGIYGWPEEANKHKTWSLLHSLCQDSDLPIVIGGDFNEILNYDEKEGGSTRDRREMDGFRNLLTECGLGDLRAVGQWYTWERGNSPETRIRERLDRFLVTRDWQLSYSDAYVEHLVRYRSDHSAILLRGQASNQGRSGGSRGRFKFETCWLLEEGCEEVVKKAWEEGEGVTIQERIGVVARELMCWGKKSCGNLPKLIDKAEKALHEAQKGPVTLSSCEECVELEQKLNGLHAKQEAYWYLRSRATEVKDGDRNTKYFHHKASQRKKKNCIKGVFDNGGVWQTDDGKIEVEVEKYFKNIFSSDHPTADSMDAVLQYVRSSITATYNEALLRPYSKEEIYSALLQMHPCKAPGPDGMHAIFYQKFWHIIGDEVYEFVSNILHNNFFPATVNCTNIALIPKVKSPIKVAEYRPISLCNVLYKIASKALVLRLKNILPAIVTENQSAFVPNRVITDNSLIALEIFHTMKQRNKSRQGIMTMKLDMSKAYDRVEWGFLRKLLLTMGFDGRWVNLVMNCVTTVSFSFLINGRVCGSVVPTRGLRQDDSLLFTRATRQECLIIVDILNQYERASGQKINYDKSEVSFSRGVCRERKEELITILNMKQVEKHQKYLGIPTIMGRSKRGVFRNIIDRVWKKLGGWKEKLISRAGKEVLLKAMEQAMPTYLMGVYKFPMAVIRDMNSLMARFWWGGKGDTRGMHWMSWDKLCKPKCMGGLGFKDLDVFNDALLGRQVWRLIHYKNSLLSRVMKAKYYPNCEMLQASLGYSNSFSWVSIWSAKSLVKEGIMHRVGNGMNINIWRDPWVGDEMGRFIESEEKEELKVVGDLIDHEKMEWRYDLIDCNFSERDKKCIYAIPLSFRGGSDDYMWAYSKEGTYTVKTAYMIGKGGNLDEFHGAWVNLWSMELSPKVRHFIWRICTRTLPVRAALKHRHITAIDACPWCPDLEETMEHAIFSCRRIRHLWTECECYQMWENRSDEDLMGRVEKWAKLDGKMVQRGCILAWNLWFERNKFVFENVVTPLEIVVQRVYKQAEEYNSYSKLIYSGTKKTHSPSPKKWVAPPPGFTKINSDASLSDEGWVGLGAVARDDKGRVLFSVVKRVQAWWPPEVAEAKAILLAVYWAKKKGLSNIIVESDAQVIISRLSMGALFFADLDAVLGDIISLCSVFNFTSFSHVKRDGNAVAHHLAKVMPFGYEQCWVNHCPSVVAPYVLMDILSLD